MYIIDKPNTLVSPIDDAKYTAYQDKNLIIYITEEGFHNSIMTLKGAFVNNEHRQNEIVGRVIDVVHNLDGIKTYEGEFIDPKTKPSTAKWYAIIQVEPQYYEAMKKKKGVSTELAPVEKVLPENFETLDCYVKETDNIEGGKPNVVYTKVEYTGLAFTDTPRKSVSSVLYNSMQPIGFFEKKLDNEKNNINARQTINSTMNNEPQNQEGLAKALATEIVTQLTPVIENAFKPKMNTAEEPKKEEMQNTAGEEDKYTALKNSVDNLASKLENFMSVKKNTADEDKDDKMENSSDEEKKDESLKNSAKSVGKKFEKGLESQQEIHLNSVKQKYTFNIN